MKRLTGILLLLLGCGNVFASLHTYTDTSVLSKGNFVKIRTEESGMYRLTYEEISAMGLDPRNVRVLGYGGALLDADFRQPKIDDLPSVAFYMHKGADGVFGAGDYILFYAQGPVQWTYNAKSGRFVHTLNYYSQYGYYFLSDNAGEQRLLNVERTAVDADDVQAVTTFSDCQVHERELINLVDGSGRSGGGRVWYGECLTATENTLRCDFRMPNVVEGSSVHCYVNMAAYSDQNARVQVKLDNVEKMLEIPSRVGYSDSLARTNSLNAAFAVQAGGDTRSLTLTYQNPLASSKAYLNYVELTAQRQLILTDNLMFVRNVENYGSAMPSLYKVRGASEETQVWNLSRLDSICAVPTELVDGELRFLGENTSLQVFAVLNPAKCAWKKPVVIGKVANQNLHALKDIDMVVLTHADFVAEAQRLAAAHEQYDGLTTAVVTDQQVYNEFSSGTPDATAYRWIMKMLYDRANASAGSQHAPRYLLLMGDGTFDNRKLLSTSGDNILLTYQAAKTLSEPEAYATDDYFTYLDDSECTNEVRATMDISVGRFPVRTQTQAAQMVEKTIRYMRNETMGNWKTQLCFLADDGDSGAHTRGADMAAEAVRGNNPDFVVNKIYIDAYQQTTNASSESYPVAKNKLDNLLQNGVLLFVYSGHGGYNNITNEGMLDARQIRQMGNTNLAFWLFATCSFSHFDSQIVSAGEEAVLNPNGGAVAVLSACRTVYANQNDYLNKNVCTALFEHDADYRYSNSIGDAIRLAKNRLKQLPSSCDKNMLAYILLGDPAVRLHYPDSYRVETEALPDTLHALATQTLKGYVCNAAKDTIGFNGKIAVTVWDKKQTQQTKDNDQTDESKKVKYPFIDYPNILFKGEAEVVDGRFEIAFMVPKDIRYNYGNGRIAYYAYDADTREEAMGHYEDFTVGGSSDMLIADNDGPELRLYLNNPAFTNGGKTNEYPHFYAYISDENGINTVGSGIGHDLTMIVDANPQQTYILNEYFSADVNSYQAGTVSYRLAEMTEGKHSLTFRAWDLLNNSSTAQLDFEVVKGLAPEIFSVMTYPNPVSQHGTLTLVIQHDKPDAVLQTLVTVYDMSGRMVWQYAQTGTDNIRWNLNETALQTGMYFYRVQIKTEESDYTSKTGKLIVTQ